VGVMPKALRGLVPFGMSGAPAAEACVISEPPGRS
jgi:hypothetical protein